MGKHKTTVVMMPQIQQSADTYGSLKQKKSLSRLHDGTVCPIEKEQVAAGGNLISLIAVSLSLAVVVPDSAPFISLLPMLLKKWSPTETPQPTAE